MCFFKQFIAYSDKVSLSAMISDQLRSLWNYQQLIWGEKYRYNDSILKEVKVQLFKSVGHHFFWQYWSAVLLIKKTTTSNLNTQDLYLHSRRKKVKTIHFFMGAPGGFEGLRRWLQTPISSLQSRLHVTTNLSPFISCHLSTVHTQVK